MSTSDKIHRLAIEYFEKSKQLKEKRRKIDFDMTKHLKSLENNNQAVEGKLAILDYKHKIKGEEEFYLQLQQELNEISEEFRPLLIAVDANRHDKLDTKIGRDTYIDSFIDEHGEIICTGPFTHLKR